MKARLVQTSRSLLDLDGHLYTGSIEQDSTVGKDERHLFNDLEDVHTKTLVATNQSDIDAPAYDRCGHLLDCRIVTCSAPALISLCQGCRDN